jgi:hypothetical protein
MKLPKVEQNLEEWQTAIGCLIGAAEGRDFVMQPRGCFWRRKMSCGLFNLPSASDRLRAVFLFGWIFSTLPFLKAWR